MSSPSDYDIELSGEMSQVRGTGQLRESWDWFQRIWAIGVIAHIVGNPRIGQVVGEVTLLGVASLATGLLAVAAVLRSDDRRLLVGLTAAVPITAWLEAPMLSNHWMLASLVSLALAATFLLRRSWAWFSTTARGMHLAFYLFAAFAKLNSDFFETTVSCALVFANQTLESAGLPVVAHDSFLATMLPYLTAGTELAIPLLLLNRRTRFAGVVLGMIFHSLLSFDLGQHIYDFSGVLFPLFLLWLPSRRLDSLGEYLPERTQVIVGIVLTLFVVATILPATQGTFVLLTRGFFLLWIPFAISLTAFVIAIRPGIHDTSIRPPDAVAWVLLALVILNGLTPYTEIKSANAWNMYSNLAVVNGESNHLIIRSGFPIGDGHADLVEILSTDDPGLSLYVDSGWLLPERNFRDYLAEHPDARVEYRQGSAVRTGIGAELAENRPVVLEKLALLRAVDVNSPVRCERVWLPAR
jgi:hypothetical protein